MPAIDEDDRPKKKIAHEIGQDLTLLSVDELARAHRSLCTTRSAGSKPTWRKSSASRIGGRSVFQAVILIQHSNATSSVALKPSTEKNFWHCAYVFKLSLSFLDHYWHCPSSLDIEWLLSTLFDASLLSP